MNLQDQVAAGVSSAFENFKNLFVSKATADLEAVRPQLTAATATVSEQGLKITDLETKLAAAQADVAARDLKITELEGKLTQTTESVDARANQKALNIEQQRGVVNPVKEEAGTNSGGTGTGESALEQFRKITDPKERAEFFAKNKDAIYSK